MTGWIDWNFCLDMEGGPNWAGFNLDSAIIVNPVNYFFQLVPLMKVFIIALVTIDMLL